MARKTSNGRSKRSSDDAADSPGGSSRALWSGSIAFGLVQIPVRIQVAERSKQLSFHQLDKHDKARIHYERVNERTGKPVAWGDIVKGYEISRGNFVIVDDADFEKANIEATHTIDIQDFVDRSEIPVAYFEKPYFLVPERNGKHAYGILRDALAEKGLVAIALVVIRTRQRLCAIMPEGDGLELVIMRFENELVPVSQIEGQLPHETKATPKEKELAEELVEKLTSKFDPSKYEDTYTRDLLAAIEEKAEKGSITALEPAQGKAPARVVDLVSLLQKSVAATASGAAGEAKKAKPGVRSASHHRKTKKEKAA
jgi:DNA end-binding protein Ku